MLLVRVSQLATWHIVLNLSDSHYFGEEKVWTVEFMSDLRQSQTSMRVVGDYRTRFVHTPRHLIVHPCLMPCIHGHQTGVECAVCVTVCRFVFHIFIIIPNLTPYFLSFFFWGGGGGATVVYLYCLQSAY